jgi:hypothetical protein
LDCSPRVDLSSAHARAAEARLSIIFVSRLEAALRVQIKDSDANHIVPPRSISGQLSQPAISGLGSRMFIGEPQEQESEGGNEEIAWKNQSNVPWRKIVSRDHLVDVTFGRSQ